MVLALEERDGARGAKAKTLEAEFGARFGASEVVGGVEGLGGVWGGGWGRGKRWLGRLEGFVLGLCWGFLQGKRGEGGELV